MIQTSLLFRKVITPWDGKLRGRIVAVFVDRGELFIAIEAPVNGNFDGRTQISVEAALGVVLKGSGEL